MNKKILIMGLPGSGKTTLARALAPKLGAVHWNADAVRANINSHLGFSEADRIEQARRMGWLCDQVVAAGSWAIADFVCPTLATRAAFGPATVIWVDTIREGRFEDTNKLFVNPEPGSYYFRVDTQDCEFWSKYIMEELDFDTHPTWVKAMLKGLKLS
jgi:adenylate kinase family enzyme